MTKAEWDALSRRTQLRVLDHMRASTTHAWTLTDDQLERVLNGFFGALDCSSAEPCAACRLEWTKPAGARSASGEDRSDGTDDDDHPWYCKCDRCATRE